MVMPTDPVSTLLRQYKRGVNVFDEIERQVGPQIQRFVSRDRRLAGIADDVSQETLLTIHRRIQSYDQERPGMPWIIGLTKTAALRAKSKHWRIAMTERSFSSNGHEGRSMLDMLPAPERPSDIAEKLWDTIYKLPRNLREPLLMRYVECTSYPEIAAKLKRSTSSVASAVNRGIDKLKEEYGLTIPSKLRRRARDYSLKKAAESRKRTASTPEPTRASAPIGALGIILRFNRIYPRLPELEPTLAAIEAMLENTRSGKR